MGTNLEFRSAAFPPFPGEEEQINPGRYGRRLAEFLSAELSTRGFEVDGVRAEDWGWRIDLRHNAFALWIGCGNSDEQEDGFLCFIQPSQPFVRQWLKRIPTLDPVERLATALESIIRESGQASHLRWWTDAETETRAASD